MNSSAGHRPEVRPEFRPGSPPEAPWPLEAADATVNYKTEDVAARVLDRLLWPRLDASQRTLLRHRCIEIESVETAVRVRLVLGERGFEVARAGLAPVVVIRAQTAALLRLARGEDDADRLFFERRLVMEGDTEFALLLKNTLDAIGPLWAPTPR